MLTPAISTRNVGWKIDSGVSSDPSAEPWPTANQRTPSATVEATTSISADSRSTTSTMPSGTGQPPTDTAVGPVASACSSSTTDTASTAVRTARLIVRWVRGWRPTSRVPAAPSSGSSTGSGVRTEIIGRSRPEREGDVVGQLVRAGCGAAAGLQAVGVPGGTVLRCEFVGIELVGVGVVPPGDATVLLVVGHGLVAGQRPRAVDHREHEGRDAEGDHDRGEDQRLRQRIAHVLRLGVAEDRRQPAEPAGGQQQQVGRVAQQQEADQHAGQAAVEQQVDAGGVEAADDDRQDDGRGHRTITSPGSASIGSSSSSWRSSSAPSDRRMSSTRPTTIR